MFGGNALVFYDHGEVEERILVNWSDIHHFLNSADLDMKMMELPDDIHTLVYDNNSRLFDKYAECNHAANIFLISMQVELQDLVWGNALIVQNEALLNLNA